MVQDGGGTIPIQMISGYNYLKYPTTRGPPYNL
jgi:hypothetical protein